MEDSQTLHLIGGLLKQARLAKHATQEDVAEAAGVSLRAYQNLERGDTLPREVNLAKIETAAGWRPGAIRELWANREHTPSSSVTLAYMAEAAAEASWDDLAAEAGGGPVKRASQLTDEELAAELAYRLRNYRDELLRRS